MKGYGEYEKNTNDHIQDDKINNNLIKKKVGK